MGHVNANRPGAASIVAVVLGATLVGANVLIPAAANVAQAQTEPATAANGVLLPPLDYDPAAARTEVLAGTAVVPAAATPPVESADASTVADAPEAAADAPDDGSAMTTSLGGSDVAVSSVGGSYEVDRPKKRSQRKK